MLGSISSLGERARSRRWLVTVASLAGGGILAGVSFGLLFGSVGQLASAAPSAKPLILGALFAVAFMMDAFWLPRSIGVKRQVNDQWLFAYPGWVAGAGFGLQLGFGLATIANSAAIYALVGTIVLVGDVSVAVLIGAVYGLARALVVLPAGRIRTSTDLAKADAWLRKTDPIARWMTAVTMLLIAVSTLVLPVGGGAR
jgi:hypothetical protein